MAYGILNLSQEDAWKLTIAEIVAKYTHRIEYEQMVRRENYQVMDNINAFNTLIQTRCVGSDKGELEDFKLYKEEIEVSEIEKTPEELSNIIMMMAKTGVLKPTGGD